jgi:hypothetical protein
VLEFLMLYTSSQGNLLSDLAAVRYVDGEAEEDEYLLLHRHCAELADMLEGFEMLDWHGGSGEGGDKAVALVQKLHALAALCVCADVHVDAVAQRRRLRQNALRHIGMVPLCMELLEKVTAL